MDLRLTRDGVPVVIHDPMVDRTTDGKGRVAEMSFEDIRRLDAGGWYGEEFRGARVPTFGEVLDLLPEYVGAVIELKVPGLEEAVVREVSERGIEEGVIVLSSFWEFLKRTKELDPRIATMADVPIPTGESVPRMMEVHANIASFHVSKLDVSFVRRCHRHGLLVNTWPVNGVDELEGALNCKVDFITTDDPARIIGALSRL